MTVVSGVRREKTLREEALVVTLKHKTQLAKTIDEPLGRLVYSGLS